MGRWTADRWAAASGMGFAVLVLIGGLIPGEPENYTASAADITSYLQDKHSELVIGALLFGIGYVLFLWFVGSLSQMFSDAGERRLAKVILGAGVVTVTIGATSDAISVTLARFVSFGDPETVRGLYGLQFFVFERVYWPAAALTFATAVAVHRSKVLSDWYVWVSALAGIAAVLGGLSLRTTGFFSPSGEMPLIAFLFLLAWVFVSSLLLVRRAAAAEAPSPAAQPM